MTSRQLAFTVDGLTHASSVIPLESCSEAELGIVTTELVPLNDSASPNLPAVDHVALLMVPLFPLPEASVTVVPEPSLNPYAATRPEVAASATRECGPTSEARNNELAQLLM